MFPQGSLRKQLRVQMVHDMLVLQGLRMGKEEWQKEALVGPAIATQPQALHGG